MRIPDLFRSCYVVSLEAEVRRLREALASAEEERRGMMNSLLGHLGAPTVEFSKRALSEPAKPGRGVVLPSMFRRHREQQARQITVPTEEKGKADA